MKIRGLLALCAFLAALGGITTVARSAYADGPIVEISPPRVTVQFGIPVQSGPGDFTTVNGMPFGFMFVGSEWILTLPSARSADEPPPTPFQYPLGPFGFVGQ